MLNFVAECWFLLPDVQHVLPAHPAQERPEGRGQGWHRREDRDDGRPGCCRATSTEAGSPGTPFKGSISSEKAQVCVEFPVHGRWLI